MHEIDLSEDTRRKLIEHAQRENCSVGTLLNRLLDNSDEITCPALKAVMETVPVSIVFMNRDLIMTSVSRSTVVELHRFFPDATMIGKSISEFLMPEYREDFQRCLKQALAGEACILQRSITSIDGQDIYYHFHFQPVFDTDNQVTGICLLSDNLTGQRQIENALRESHAVYQSLVDVLPFSLYRTDDQRRLTFVNNRILEELNTPLEEVLGRTAADFYPPELAAKYLQDDLRVLEGENFTEVEEHYRPADGSTQYVEVIKTPLRDADGNVTGIQGLFWDVSARFRAQETLRKSEERYRIVSELSSDYAYAYLLNSDKRLELEWVTDSFSRLTGYKPGDVANELNIYHEEDRQRVMNDVRRVLKGERTLNVYRIFTRDGNMLWMQVNQYPRWNEDKIIGLYGTAQNITAQKSAEQAHMEQQRLQLLLKKEQELNAIQTNLIMTISHEFRTPLAVINSSSELLSNYFDRISPEQRVDKLAKIQKQIRHLTTMLDEISMVVRGAFGQDILKLKQVNLEQLCLISIKEIEDSSGSQHRFNLRAQGKFAEITLDEKLVSRILINLLSNAVKYSPKGSQINIELYREINQIVIAVSDEGMGISPEEKQHIFDPLFRASGAASIKGMGLGLSIVQECVKLHQGEIEVDTGLIKGTRFIVRLPLDLQTPATYR